MKLGNLSLAALAGSLNRDQSEIFAQCLAEAELLLAKNTDYGSSALQAPLLAPHVPVTDAILTRMSDKVQRMLQLAKTGPQVKTESFEDTLLDFSGYVKLYKVAKSRENAEKEAQAPEASRLEPVTIEGRPQSTCQEEGRKEVCCQEDASQEEVRFEAPQEIFENRDRKIPGKDWRGPTI